MEQKVKYSNETPERNSVESSARWRLPRAATVDQTGIRGSEPHDLIPSGAASV